MKRATPEEAAATERRYVECDHRPFYTNEQLLVRVEGRRQVAIEQRMDLMRAVTLNILPEDGAMTVEERRAEGVARLDAIIAEDEKILAEIRAEMSR